MPSLKTKMNNKASRMVALILAVSLAWLSAGGQTNVNVKSIDGDKLFPDKDGFFFPHAPYLYDPISKDVGDPTILFNHDTGAAWVFYTQRDTMKAEGPGWYHGCDIGIQSSQFGGFSWVYRGAAEGLNTYMPGRNTFWAPEVVFHEGVYHMFVTFHIGVPLYAGEQAGKYIFDEANLKSGGIVHYTSTNMIQWAFRSRLRLEPDNGQVIDAGVHPLRDGTWRMWYRAIDNAHKAILGYADSKDLYRWENKGIAVNYDGYAEGPCVFFWKGSFWMLLDGMSEKYRPAEGGLAVLKSADATQWEFQQGGLAYDSTTRAKDGKPGHCSVIVQGERAFILYHCFAPGARGATGQLAELLVTNGKLSCVRDVGRMKLEASKAPRFRGGGALDIQPLTATPEASLVVHADHDGATISPLLYGVFFEEINRGGDGGLYAEMLENRSFEDSEQEPVSWYGKGQAVLALDKSLPINPRNPTALRVELSGDGGGVMNGGFRNLGVSVTKGADYKLSFFARADKAFGGILKARLAGRNGNMLAEQTVKGIGSSWKKFEVTFASAETDTAARLALEGMGSGTLWFDMVSLFPGETWKDHGMRKDIAESIAALKPGFVRFPGGCFVEGGDKLANAVRWKETVGPVEERKGNYCTWGYQTTGGFGTFEFFQWCEDLGAEPLYVINCGMSHQEQVPLDKMQEWVQDALDLIEYARGPADSKWGSLRAKAGHAAPFKLNYLEIGNENIGPKYQERYILFHDAIKAKYPDIKLVAGEPVAQRNCDIVDLHGYHSPHYFRAHADEFNTYDRTATKVYIGEYAAITPDCGLGNLQAALGEAAYLTGLERNADCVVMSSYAPLFLNPSWRRWAPCAIVLNQERSYATPSFHVQTLFANNLGAIICPDQLTVEDSICAAPAGGISLGTWASQAEYKDIKVVRKDGSVLFDSAVTPGMGPWRKNGGAWSVVEGALRQNDAHKACMILAGSAHWGSDYTVSLKARKLGGSEGFLIGFQLHLNDPGEKHWLNLGGWNNTRFALEGMGTDGGLREGRIESNRWYDIRIELEADTVACFLDGQEILRQKQKTIQHLFAAASKTKNGSDLIMKVVNTSERPITTDIRIEGSVHLNPTGKMWVITGEQGSLENSFDQPRAIAPVESQISGITNRFDRTFPARSVTVMRLGMQKHGL